MLIVVDDVCYHSTMPEIKTDVAMLDAVFGALSDPVRREILNQLDGKDLLVTELAAPFKISL